MIFNIAGIQTQCDSDPSKTAGLLGPAHCLEHFSWQITIGTRNSQGHQGPWLQTVIFNIARIQAQCQNYFNKTEVTGPNYNEFRTTQSQLIPLIHMIFKCFRTQLARLCPMNFKCLNITTCMLFSISDTRHNLVHDKTSRNFTQLNTI